MASAAASTVWVSQPRRQTFTLANLGLVVFFFVYYARPMEWRLGWGRIIAFADIAALITLVGFLIGAVSNSGLVIHRIARRPEVKGLLLLYLYMWFTVPTAIWRGGSFALLTQVYLKVTVVIVILAVVVDSLPRLKRLIYIAALAMSVLSVLAIWAYLQGVVGRTGRAGGWFYGLFHNPNELALNVVLLFPFCFMFMVSARRLLARLFWGACVLAMISTVLVTYSRMGFLALSAGSTVLIWQFGVKGRRPTLVLLCLFLAGTVLLWLVPMNYGSRVASIFEPELDETGSALARGYLLRRSLGLMAQNPLLGLGPGNFDQVSGIWRQPHNTYLQLGVEVGIPAMLLFIWVLRHAFRSAAAACRNAADRPEVLFYGQALRACLVALTVALFFIDASYHYYAYFPIAYAVILSRIAQQPSEERESQR